MIIATRELSYHMSEEGRYFFSPKAVKGFRDEKAQPDRSYAPKPNGLWYACGDAWLDWVSGEVPEWMERWNYLYEVFITDAVLQLPTEDDILEFSERYHTDRWNIDWASVAKVFPGIEICPYQWSLRMGLGWYYTWDVASGCIWNRKGLKGMRPIAEKVGEDRWRLL